MWCAVKWRNWKSAPSQDLAVFHHLRNIQLKLRWIKNSPQQNTNGDVKKSSACSILLECERGSHNLENTRCTINFGSNWEPNTIKTSRSSIGLGKLASHSADLAPAKILEWLVCIPRALDTLCSIPLHTVHSLTVFFTGLRCFPTISFTDGTVTHRR